MGLAFGLVPLLLLIPLPPWSSSKDQYVGCACFGIADFGLAAVGTWLFWAVRDLRLHRAKAVLLYVGAAIVSLFVPLLLMHGSKTVWPDLFSGDGGWALIFAPLMMVQFSVAALIVFCISLIFARWHRRAAASQPPTTV